MRKVSKPRTASVNNFNRFLASGLLQVVLVGLRMITAIDSDLECEHLIKKLVSKASCLL